MTKESGNIVVLITTATEEEAHRIAELLVKQRKTACVNIVPGVNSLFWWEGKLDSAKESLLIVKAKMSSLKKITELVKGVHSYEVPEIIALPILGGNEDYLNWLDTVIEQ